ncbi:unnamed protein product [marine sediment metagenome]|uniref:Uncharacterized protein n=1 Tax=marine sediment metagenome TaxID=412755 RepID=X0VLV9_9ZZZZ
MDRGHDLPGLRGEGRAVKPHDNGPRKMRRIPKPTNDSRPDMGNLVRDLVAELRGTYQRTDIVVAYHAGGSATLSIAGKAVFTGPLGAVYVFVDGVRHGAKTERGT